MYAFQIKSGGYRLDHGDLNKIVTWFYNDCTVLSNTDANKDLFVPTGWSTWWLSFRNHRPNYISLEESADCNLDVTGCFAGVKINEMCNPDNWSYGGSDFWSRECDNACGNVSCDAPVIGSFDGDCR